MRSEYFRTMLTVLHCLFALCRHASRANRSLEVLEMPQRRIVALTEHARRLAMGSARIEPEDAAPKKIKQKGRGGRPAQSRRRPGRLGSRLRA